MNIIKSWFSKLSKVNKWLLRIGGSLLIVGISYTAYWSYYWEIENVKYEIKAFLGDPYSRYILTPQLDYSSLCKADSWDFSWVLEKHIKLAKQGNKYSRKSLFDNIFSRSSNSCFNFRRNFDFERNRDHLLDDLLKDGKLSWLFDTDFAHINWIDKEDPYNASSFASLISFYYRRGDESLGKMLFDDVVVWCRNFKGSSFGVENSERCLNSLRKELYSYQDIWRSDGFWDAYLSLDDGSEDYQFQKARIAVDRSRYNDTQALNVIKQLANKGNRLALEFVGRQYMFGADGGFERNFELAEKYLLLSDTAKAHLNLYELYRMRKGWKSNDVLLYHLEKAQVNQAYDYLELADLYFEMKNYAKAKEKYEYILHRDDPRNYSKREDAEKDAKFGIKSAERLGDIYYQGLGLRQDLAKAKEYYGIACDYKAQSACDKFREVNEKIR